MLEFVAVGCVQDPRDRPPHDGPVSFHGLGPAGGDQALRFGAARMGREQARGPFLAGPEQEDFAGVRVRGALLDVEVVAVVPADDEPEVRHRCVGRGPRAHGDPGGAAEHAQEAAVARRLAVVCGEPGDVAGGKQFQQGRFHAVKVPVVGHHHDGAAAGDPHRGHGFGDHPRPAGGPVPLQGGQHGPGRLPRGEVGEECRTVAVPGPDAAGSRRRKRHVGRQTERLSAEQRGIEPAVRGEFLFELGHARRHGNAQDIADRSGVARGDPAGELGHCWGQDRDGGEHLVQRHQGVAGVGSGGAVQQVSGQFLPVEFDHDPDSGHGVGVEGGGDAVVERPVQVGQRGLDQHPRHRQVGRKGGAGRFRGGGGKTLEQGQLLGFTGRAAGRIGTHGSHLPPDCFDNDLLTGYSNSGT